MKTGDRVRINERAFGWHGIVGEIFNIQEVNGIQEYHVRWGNHDRDWDIFYRNEIDRVEE